MQLDKFEETDFKYHNIFLKCEPRNAPKIVFGPKFRYCFFVKFCKLTNLKRTDFKYDHSFFMTKVLFRKYPNKAFLVPHLNIFVVFKEKLPIRQKNL